MWFLLPFILFLPLIATSDEAVLQQQAFAQCSQSVHDSYTTIFNNVQYATWHPQIDLAHNCYHGHEHGSNPNLLWPNGPKPLFGYTMPSESHNGFKVFVLDLDSMHRAMITLHFGTANAVNAVCNRFHTVDVVIIDSTTGEMLADTHMHGDFGKPVVNETNELIRNSCVDAAAGSNGTRQFPVANMRNIGYEPWRLHFDNGNNAYGFSSGAITFNTRNPKTACDTVTCTQTSQRTDPGFNTPSNGSIRTVEIPRSFGFTGAVSGTFEVQHGLRQYVKPGWSLMIPRIDSCWPVDPHSYAYQCRNVAADQSPFYRNSFITEAN